MDESKIEQIKCPVYPQSCIDSDGGHLDHDCEREWISVEKKLPPDVASNVCVMPMEGHLSLIVFW